MIQLIAFGSPDYLLTLTFRERHLRRPLGLELTAEDRVDEELQFHIASVEAEGIVGTVVLKPMSHKIARLRQMAVAPERRNSGLGRDLVSFAETIADRHGFDRIEMDARLTARRFYERLGYEAHGDAFIEVTIPHIKMSKELSAC